MAIADNFNTIVTFQKFPNFWCNDLQSHYLFNLWSLKLTIYRKDKSSLHHSIVYLSLVPMTKHLEDCQWWRGWWERSGPDIEAGTNLSLALTHHILNQTVLHLLNVHVHGPGQFLEFDKPEYVMSLRENQPPGGDQGWSCHPVRSQRESEVRILFVPRQILDQVLDQDQLWHQQHCQCHPHHSQTSGSRQEDICRSQVGKIWLCWY